MRICFACITIVDENERKESFCSECVNRKKKYEYSKNELLVRKEKVLGYLKKI
jgi:hypothetical protein